MSGGGGRAKISTAFAPVSLLRLSKAHLADIAWNLAGMTVNSAEDTESVMRAVMDESARVSEDRGDVPLEVLSRRRAARLARATVPLGDNKLVVMHYPPKVVR